MFNSQANQNVDDSINQRANGNKFYNINMPCVASVNGNGYTPKVSNKEIHKGDKSEVSFLTLSDMLSLHIIFVCVNKRKLQRFQ